MLSVRQSFSGGGAFFSRMSSYPPGVDRSTSRSEDFLGETTGDLASRRGQINSINDRSPLNLKVIDSLVPLSEMFGYATSLRSLTQGRGTFNMEFSRYEIVPQNISQLIIDGKK